MLQHLSDVVHTGKHLEEKQQGGLNMKRLFKKWLKRQLVKIAIDTKRPIQTGLFDWIYSSPIHTWRDKLLIVKSCNDFCGEYYCWLHKDTSCSTDNMISDLQEERLRFDLIAQTGFSLNEIPFVMRFVKGDCKAIEELQEFRDWKEEQNFKKMLTPSQEEG